MRTIFRRPDFSHVSTVLEYDFHSSVGYWTCITAHLFERAMNEELVPRGITYRQCQVLAWLALEGSLSQVDLASRMNIEPPTLVGVLDRMERDGLLERRSCEEDRRKKIVVPLPRADPMWKTIVGCAERVRARATRGLSPGQIATLNELLACLRSNLAQESTAQAEFFANPP
jgi:MarR family transcriptional regulator for hemolysin